MKFYGKPLPNVEIEAYSGKLIVIEGTDGVGRSTHVALLRTWLEAMGHAVLDTGMTRSVLAGRGIKNARAGHTLGRLTMQLYYATDFADRLENQMLPALHAGFIVLTDRYIYSAIARAVVRGADPEWMRAIYGIGLVPDAVFYLRLGSVEELAARLLASGRGFDYWESGMDLGLGNDYYDSFIAYQKLLLKEFDRMSGEYGFQVIDASRSIKRVENDLKRLITRVIESEQAKTEAMASVAGSPNAKENIPG
ncbi:MAG: thymidylate kinase [Acidobacteria bacterium]|nr:MAG: thymidylate kinase [Acidobacteriota bacterium]